MFIFLRSIVYKFIKKKYKRPNEHLTSGQMCKILGPNVVQHGGKCVKTLGLLLQNPRGKCVLGKRYIAVPCYVSLNESVLADGQIPVAWP